MIGTTVSHYRIISHIGAGGMGTVYLAEDTNLKRRVALKFLPPETAGDPEAAARLLREARAASALDHPHIATIYEIGDHAGQPFIAMAHYEGETLAARLARGPLPMAEIARIVAQMADALDAAHAAGIVHRDLKPSNLMLTTTGQVKVLDFGLAKIETGETATQLTRAGSTVGTAAYMSPEQAAGEAVDARSDLWSLGVVTYEMLAGRPPFKGTNALAIIHAVLTATPAPVRTLRPDVAPELEEIVTGRSCATASGARSRQPRCAISHRRATRGCRRPDNSLRSRGRGRRAARGLRPRSSRSLVAAGGIAWWAQRNAKVRWARQEALPEIIRLAGADKFDDAYRLAQQAQPYIPDDPLLAEQMTADLPTRGASTPIRPAPSVFYRPYGRSGEPWRPLGKTPVADAERATRPAALESRDGRPRDGGRRRSWPVARSRDIHFTLFPREPGPGRHGAHRIGRAAVQDFHTRRSNTFPRSTCRTTGSIATRSRTARSSGSWTTADTGARSCGASRS